MSAIQNIQERRRYIIDRYSQWAMSLYTETGKFTGDPGQYEKPDMRDRMRTATILLAHGGNTEQQVAETLISQIFVDADGNDLTLRDWKANFHPERPPGAMTDDWNIFESNDASKTLAIHGDRLSPEIVAKLKRITKRNFLRFAGSAQGDYLPLGFNDNMPAGAMAGLILGGEALGNTQATEDGLYRLELMAELLSRRGLISEHSSSTYSPITICEVAEIAEFSRTPAIRELALKVEAHLWVNFIMNFHLGTARNNGAMTRAYNINNVGHVDSFSLLMWILTGLPNEYNPVDFMITPKTGQVTHFDGCFFKTFGGKAIFAVEYHCPDYLLSALESRHYPFHFSATSETGGEHGDSAVSWSYHQQNYGLASSTNGFFNHAQSNVFYAVYRLKEQISDFGDTNSVFTRLFINDQVYGAKGKLPGCEDNGPGSMGIMRAVQKDNTAMILSRFGNGIGEEKLKNIHCLRQVIIFPCHYMSVPEIRIGKKGTSVDPVNCQIQNSDVIFLNFNNTIFMAFQPLALTDLGRKHVVRTSIENNYFVISLINYEGEKRAFTTDQLQEVFNGFIVDISDSDEFQSFDNFIELYEPGQIEDWWFHKCRRTRVKRSNKELMMNWLTEADRIKNAVVDGRQISSQMIQADGFDERQLPFVKQPFSCSFNSPPEDSLELAWYPDMKHQCRQTKLLK